MHIIFILLRHVNVIEFSMSFHAVAEIHFDRANLICGRNETSVAQTVGIIPADI